MQKLVATDLLSLEAYARERPAMRTGVIAHKQSRKVHIGKHVTLIFEDRLTIQYQIQEMLRVERIFEADAIAEELNAYNPLIPDGMNLKATMLIEYPDEAERTLRLFELHDIERRVSIRIGDARAVVGIADEDMQRSTEQKTSAVHFLRFELDSEAVAAFKAGQEVLIAIDHPAYLHSSALETAIRTTLAGDFD